MTMDINEWIDSIYQALGLILFFYNKQNDEFVLYTDINLDIKSLFEINGIKGKLNKTNCDIIDPVFISNSINCVWISIPTNKEPKCNFCVIGPTLISPISKEQIIKYYCQKGLSIEQAVMLSKEYEKIPIVPYPLLIQLYYYIYYVLVGEKADITNFGLPQTKNEMMINKNDEKIYLIHQRDYSIGIEAERFIHDCVKKGDVDRIKQRKSNVISGISSLGPNEIRSLKNTFIISIALITRAAIEGGLPVETAYPLSDMYILQMESMSEITPIIELYHRSVIDFTTRVNKNKFKLSYSRLINQCCEYILANVNNHLYVTDVAKVFGLHPDTLSKQFKSETGIPITEYIRNTKVEEAKMLLLHTDKSLTEISNVLSYSSQSQFIVSFKRVEGITPNEFRIMRKERQNL